MPSTPSTAQMASRFARPARLSICTSTQILVVYGGEVVRHGAVAIAAMQECHAPDACRRIARGGHGAASFICRLYEGDQEVIKPNVQQPLQDNRFVHRRAHDQSAWAIFERHQLRDQREHVVGSVFGVEQQPVEARKAENFGADRVREGSTSSQ